MAESKSFHPAFSPSLPLSPYFFSPLNFSLAVFILVGSSTMLQCVYSQGSMGATHQLPDDLYPKNSPEKGTLKAGDF